MNRPTDNPDEHDAALEEMADRARESSEDRSLWDSVVDENLKIYTYGSLDYDDTPGSPIIINDIQNAVISTTDIQTKEPPGVELEPVETGDPGEAYWIGPPDLGLMLGLPPEMVMPLPGPDGVPAPPMAMDPNVAMALPVPPENVVIVNDELIAEVYQLVHDKFWKRASTDRVLRSLTLHNNIHGWAFATYEFDDERMRDRITVLANKQVYIDPTVEDVSEAAYAGVDLVLDLDKAKRMYPEMADLFDDEAREGRPDWPDGGDSKTSRYDRDYQRPVVTLRTFWFRDHPFPMTPEEAVAAGVVTAQQVHAGMPENSAQTAAPALSGTQYTLAATGEVVEESSPAWPSRAGILQVQGLGERVADYRESEHVDFPLLHNVNIPIPGKPWGMGEPFRLKKAQEAHSRQVNAIVEFSDQYRAPVRYLPNSVYDELEQKHGDVHVKNGMTIGIPDDLLMQTGGKISLVENPPQMPAALIQSEQLLKSALTDLSGHTDAVRGVLPSSQSSGKAVELLQQGAYNLMGYKAQRMHDVVERLTELRLHCIVNRIEAAGLQRIVSKYPIHVLEAIVQRARSIEWDVTIRITAGNAQAVATKRAQAYEEFGAGAISRETLREKLSIDNKQEQKRQAQEAAAMLAATGGQPPENGDST